MPKPNPYPPERLEDLAPGTVVNISCTACKEALTQSVETMIRMYGARARIDAIRPAFCRRRVCLCRVDTAAYREPGQKRRGGGRLADDVAERLQGRPSRWPAALR